MKEFGGEAHVEVNYTVSPVHTLEKWMEYAEQLIEVGADWLSLKDATGIMTPFDATESSKASKTAPRASCPVLLHCHDMGGTSSMCHLMAISRGCRYGRHGFVAAIFGSAHPATESMVASLSGTPFDTGIDLKIARRAGAITRQIKEKYESSRPVTPVSAATCSFTKYPAG